MTSKRHTLTPHPLHGWDPAHKVETERVEETPSGVRHRVFLDGEPVGFVESQGKGWWDAFSDAELAAYRASRPERARASSPRLAFGCRNRHDAVVNLLFGLGVR